MRVVQHYGLHKDDNGAPWLVQNTSTSLLMNSANPPLKMAGRGVCPHNINIRMLEPSPFLHAYFRKYIREDALGQLFLPIPKTMEDNGVYWVDESKIPPRIVLYYLGRICSPQTPVAELAWAVSEDNLQSMARLTNLSPLVFFNTDVEAMRLVRLALRIAPFVPRRIIFVGKPDVPYPSEISVVKETRIFECDPLDLKVIPWEAFGASIIRELLNP